MSKATTTEAGGSYRSLLKATSLLGGATAFNVLLGMGRVKIVALLLGPAGIGLMGAYQSILSLTTTLTGMGLSYSGVREVAEARGSGDAARLRATVTTFRRVSHWLGLAGGLALAALAWPVAWLTFDTTEHWLAVAGLGIAVWGGMMAGYHSGIIQSAQAMGRLARLNLVFAVVGTVTSLACFAAWGPAGVVPALVAGAVVQWLLAWRFANELPASERADGNGEFSPAIARRLFQFGGVMLILGVLASVAAYLQRVLVLRGLDEAALGMVQAAEALSSVYAGYILGAMGTDFLPRLSAAAGQPETLNRLINEQTVVALLLGTPGVVGTICFAATVIPLFYSADFGPAIELLRWLAVGTFGRLISWPLGYLLLALGDTRTLWLNGLSLSVQLATLWLALPAMGVFATGLAAVVMYVVHTIANWEVARRLTGFRWSREALDAMAMAGLAVALALALAVGLPKHWDMAGGVVLLLGVCAFSYRRLQRLTGGFWFRA